MIDLSLNEVESLAAKVGRGAGYSWGLADDISRASRALAAGGLPWDAALLALAETGARFAAPLQCPLLTAARINDEVRSWSEEAISFPDIALPIWLAGGLAAGGRGASLVMSWPGARLCVEAGRAAWLEGPGDGLAERADVAIRAAPASPSARLRRASADPATLARLNEIAERVFVPASAMSRARGAGGASVDDD